MAKATKPFRKTVKDILEWIAVFFLLAGGLGIFGVTQGNDEGFIVLAWSVFVGGGAYYLSTLIKPKTFIGVVGGKEW